MHTRKNRLHALLVFCALCLGAPTFALADEAPAPIEIDIQKFVFTNKDITVPVGAVVVWVNRDETPHAISAGDGSFTSKALDTDDRYEHTFDHAGDLEYFCTLHPFMTGVVHVCDR